MELSAAGWLLAARGACDPSWPPQPRSAGGAAVGGGRRRPDAAIPLQTESFANDCLVEGGERHNKTSYCEARQYRTAHHLVRFYFLTRAYSAYVESVLRDFTAGPPPDVVIVNSCLWDLNR